MHYGRCASGVFRNQLASKHLKDTYAKFYANFFLGGGVGGANKVHYGRCVRGVWRNKRASEHLVRYTGSRF